MTVAEIDLILGTVRSPRHRRWFVEQRPLEAEIPWPGDPAPDFALLPIEAAADSPPDRRTTLGDQRGRPVVLLFGSWTCPPFRRTAEDIESLRRDHADDATFLFVYTAEAHPDDGDYQVDDNLDADVLIPAARSLEERQVAGRTCSRAFAGGLTMLADDMDDAVATTYAGRPERLWIIDADGIVHWRTGPGPHGFDVDAARAALESLLAAGGRTHQRSGDPWRRVARRLDRLRLHRTPPSERPPWFGLTARVHRRRVARRWPGRNRATR